MMRAIDPIPRDVSLRKKKNRQNHHHKSLFRVVAGNVYSAFESGLFVKSVNCKAKNDNEDLVTGFILQDTLQDICTMQPFKYKRGLSIFKVGCFPGLGLLHLMLFDQQLECRRTWPFFQFCHLNSSRLWALGLNLPRNLSENPRANN